MTSIDNEAEEPRLKSFGHFKRSIDALIRKREKIGLLECERGTYWKILEKLE